jgi:hypothetical protein
MTESDQTNAPPASRRGCIVGLLIGLAMAAWVTRLVVAVARDRNGCFFASGTVVDEQGRPVPGAFVDFQTVVSPFPKTESHSNSTGSKTTDGRFSFEACNVGDVYVYAVGSGIGMSRIAQVSRSASVERMDWLGRHTYHARDMVLVLRPRASAGTTLPAPASSPSR